MSDENHNDSAETTAVLALARKLSRHYRHAYITPEHLLLAVIDAGGTEAQKIIKRGKATPAQMRKLVEHHLREGENDVPEEQLTYSERAKRVIEAARQERAKQQSPYLEPRHILQGLGKVQNSVAAAVLGAVDLKGDDIFS